ncbi:hypothetical protein MTO96_002140 [Rhipicephalus appendiculatus]
MTYATTLSQTPAKSSRYQARASDVQLSMWYTADRNNMAAYESVMAVTRARCPSPTPRRAKWPPGVVLDQEREDERERQEVAPDVHRLVVPLQQAQEAFVAVAATPVSRQDVRVGALLGRQVFEVAQLTTRSPAQG